MFLLPRMGEVVLMAATAPRARAERTAAATLLRRQDDLCSLSGVASESEEWPVSWSKRVFSVMGAIAIVVCLEVPT